jgi:DNA polymerase-3 subunit delta'
MPGTSTVIACTGTDDAMTELYPWLKEQRAALGARLERGDLPHALLITGQPGMGKLALAEHLAAMLLCEQRTAGQEPCGQCPGCRMVAAGTHPDRFTLTPEVDEKTGKQATTIKVDQVRWLAERLSLSSHRTGYKVAVLVPAEAMNSNAANSLLKTLEEPTDKTVLVLVCASPAQLPATIRSRCQQVRISAPDTALAADWLSRQQPGVEASGYLQMAGGAPLAALRLAAVGVADDRRQQLRSLVEVLDGRLDPLAVAAQWGRDAQLQAVHRLQGWLMDLVRIRLSGSTASVRSADLADTLLRLAGRLDVRDLFRQLEQLNRVLHVADGVLNRQLMLEEILLAWAGRK